MATSITSSDSSRNPLAIPQISRRSWASKEDWVRNRTLIGQLYSEKPLAKVMTLMEKEHNFRATKKMYKTHIKQWSLDKKHKEIDMRAIVRKTKQLANQEKSAKFHIRGRPVSYKEVLRYWQRKGFEIDDVIAQRAQSKTPEAVNYIISVPSPIMTPEPIAIPERILVTIRDYFRGSFGNGTWVTRDPQLGCETTKIQENLNDDSSGLYVKFFMACDLFHRNHFREAGRCLISATSGIGRYEIALAILRQFSSLAEILVGKSHPLRFICEWLARIDIWQVKDVTTRCLKSTVDHLGSLAGPLDMSSIHHRTQNLAEFGGEYDMNQSHLKDLLHECEIVLGLSDIRTCFVRESLAWHYWRMMDYFEAIKVGWDLVTNAQTLKIRRDQVQFHAEGLRAVGMSRLRMGDPYLAEVHARQAIDLLASEFGPHDNRIGKFLLFLDTCLEFQGQWDSAALVRKRLTEIIPEWTEES